MNAKISTLFFVKNTKVNTKGEVPIYLRVTVNGNRFETSINKFVEISKWSTSLKRIKGNSEEARSINEYLKIFDNKVFEAHKQLLLENKEINTDTRRNKILGKTESQKTIIDVIQVHNENMTNLLGIEYSYNTLKNFKPPHKLS